MQCLLPLRESGTGITRGRCSSYYPSKDGSFQRKSELKYKPLKICVSTVASSTDRCIMLQAAKDMSGNRKGEEIKSLCSLNAQHRNDTEPGAEVATSHLIWWFANLLSQCHAGPLRFQRNCRRRKCCEWARHPDDPRGGGRAPPSFVAASSRCGGKELSLCAHVPGPLCGS